ncbi:MAG: ArnT family glycosyltransferase [Anaerolineales bacterium]
MSRYPKGVHPLGALLVAFALLVLLHGWATPLFEAPDEVWHYAYVRWLAEGQGLPSMDDNSSGANQEVAQPPLYYGAAALFSAPFDDRELEALRWHNPGFGYQAPGTVPDNKNMLIHTEAEVWPGSESVWAVRAARLTSLLFGCLTVVAAWGLGHVTFNDRRGALFTAALVAFHPQFVFISSVVSNDAAAAALSTAALWAAARVLRHGLDPRRGAVAGFLTGLAVLTKTSTLPLLALVGLALVGRAWWERVAWRRALLPLLLFGSTALLVGGWWYARNSLLYGDPLGLTSHVETLWGRSQPASLLEILEELPLLVRSFWGAYGWGHVWWPDWIYVLLSGGALYLLGRLLWRLLRLRHRDTTELVLLLAALWFCTVAAALLYWMTQVEAPHGRLLFPALGAWALLLTAGYHYTPPESRYHTRRLLLLLMVSLALLAPGARIWATFAPPRLRSPERVRGEAPLLYEDQARLLDTQIDASRVAPGESFAVRACWQAQRAMSEDYTVFVQLFGPENRIVAARRTYPGLGRFPTSLWPTEQAFCDTYRLEVEKGAPAPVVYRLELGLFEAASGHRLGARTSEGRELHPPIVGQVAVVPSEPLKMEPTTPLDVQLGEAVALRGFDAPSRIEAGQPLTVTLHWTAREDVAEELVAFVHLWIPGAPETLLQHDSPPRNGWYPTSWWRADDRIPDSHVLPIPEDLAAGSYPLWAGLYRARDLTRLPVVGPQGPLPYDLVPLGEIEVY